MPLAFALLMSLWMAFQASDPATVERGRQLFEDKTCLLCHALGEEGGTLAGALDGVAGRRNAKALRLILEDPQEALKDSTAKIKMPKLPLDEEEVEALVAYLLTLEDPPPTP